MKCEIISNCNYLKTQFFTGLPCLQPWVSSILDKILLAEVPIVLNSCLFPSLKQLRLKAESYLVCAVLMDERYFYVNGSLVQFSTTGNVVLRTSQKICLTHEINKIETCFSRRHAAQRKNKAVNVLLVQALNGHLNAGFRCLLESQAVGCFPHCSDLFTSLGFRGFCRVRISCPYKFDDEVLSCLAIRDGGKKMALLIFLQFSLIISLVFP